MFGPRGWIIIALPTATLVDAAFSFLGRDPVYPLVFAWGCFATAYEQWNRSSLVSLLAGGLSVVAAAFTVMAALLSFYSRPGHTIPAMPRLRSRGALPATPWRAIGHHDI